MKSHMKRMSAPRTWPLQRKIAKWIVRPKPKGTPLELTLPVGLILRDMLRLVENSTQANKVLKSQDVRVNGRRALRVTDAAGFMDIVSVEKDAYRIMINKNRQLTLHPVKKGEEHSIQQVAGKTTLKGGKFQVNFASGLNLVVPKDEYKVGDSVAVKEGKITEHYPLAKGAAVLVNGGSHIGIVGTVESVDGRSVTVSAGGAPVQTSRKYAYVIGKHKPSITV